MKNSKTKAKTATKRTRKTQNWTPVKQALRKLGVKLPVEVGRGYRAKLVALATKHGISTPSTPAKRAAKKAAA